MSNTLISQIVEIEWNMFTNVNNEGGRASCQDDYPTFSIMRRSQFEEWSVEALACYLRCLNSAVDEGRNLITEKYAHMMKSTAPERYREIEAFIRHPQGEALDTAERICAVLVAQTAEYAMKYPKMALQGRSLYSADDSEYNTSIETYQRSELYTYSAETLKALEECILAKKAQGINFAESILLNTVRKYGFDSIERAEAAI